jgi:hypothetical protein
MIDFEDGVGGVRLDYSSFVPAAEWAKIDVILTCYTALPEIFAKRIRIQNLRFAHFLCGAQEMSGVIKSSSQ